MTLNSFNWHASLDLLSQHPIWQPIWKRAESVNGSTPAGFSVRFNPSLPPMAVVTLLSDFIDGTSMALAEDTDAEDLNDYMTRSQGRLWAGVQQRRRQKGLTVIRRGPGTVYFAPDADAARAVEVYLQSDTGSENERTSLEAMQAARVQIAPHVGADAERDVLLKGRLRDLTAQAQARGFG